MRLLSFFLCVERKCKVRKYKLKKKINIRKKILFLICENWHNLLYLFFKEKKKKFLMI